MKLALFTLTTIMAAMLTVPLCAQTITCPADTILPITTNVYDYRVPDAIVSGWVDFDLDRETTAINNDCLSPDTIIVVQEARRSNQSMQCTTSVIMPLYTFADLPTVPAEIEIDSIHMDSLALEILTPELKVLSKSIISTYDDHAFLRPDNAWKIIREILYLDFCSGEITSREQIITAQYVEPVRPLRPFSLNGLTGRRFAYDSLTITGSGVTDDILAVCSLGDGRQYKYLNCVQRYSEGEITIELHRQTYTSEEISTLDLVLAQRHILGLGTFDSPAQLWAADFNSNESISGSDIVGMRQHILAIEPSQLGQHSGLACESPDILPPPSGIVTIPASAFPLRDSFRLIGVQRGDINGSITD